MFGVELQYSVIMPKLLRSYRGHALCRVHCGLALGRLYLTMTIVDDMFTLEVHSL